MQFSISVINYSEAGGALWRENAPCQDEDCLLKLFFCQRDVTPGRGGGDGLTCSVRRRVLRKNPKRHPMTTASTDMMRSPFCLQTFFTLTHTASKATAILSHLVLRPTSNP